MCQKAEYVLADAQQTRTDTLIIDTGAQEARPKHADEFAK